MPALMLATFLLAGIAATSTAQAQTYTVLYNFGGVPGDPEWFGYSGVIAQGRDGKLYSTSNGSSNAFDMTTGGTLTVLYTFNGYSSGFDPEGGLVLGTDGNYYGANFAGGTDNLGNLFKLSSSGQLTALYSFTCGSDSASPPAAPIQGWDGNFYGVSGGDVVPGYCPNVGAIYKLTPSGAFTSLYQFDGTQGAEPYAPLIQGTDGNFYGTTSARWGGGVSSVFRITPSGVFTALHIFDWYDGYGPYCPLVQGRDGNFYGTASSGGNAFWGVVFKITPAGVYSILHNFAGGTTDGAYPFAGLVQATDGNFYGTTSQGGTMNYGTIFRITPQGDFSILYNFDDTTGRYPYITQASTSERGPSFDCSPQQAVRAGRRKYSARALPERPPFPLTAFLPAFSSAPTHSLQPSFPRVRPRVL